MEVATSPRTSPRLLYSGRPAENSAPEVKSVYEYNFYDAIPMDVELARSPPAVTTSSASQAHSATPFYLETSLDAYITMARRKANSALDPSHESPRPMSFPALPLIESGLLLLTR